MRRLARQQVRWPGIQAALLVLAACASAPARAEPLKVPAKAAASPPRDVGARAIQPGRPAPRHTPRKSPYCQGTYASDLVAVAPEARRLEETTRYTFCVRSTAVYQCAYYGPDGSLMSRRAVKNAHGTAFAFRREGNNTYFLTNEHVTEWPFVTGKESLEGVPPGCKRVSQTVAIVDDENDSYAKDDLSLQRVVVDAELDTAILKAPTRVPLVPFGVGQSAALKVGDGIRVRGFPLGAFQAVHAGKVVSAREPDREGKWDHWDFVVDAQLSTGNSGSPVLAVSCRTRRFELVGIYHAGYKRGAALNVVVGVDEFRELMTTLKPRSKQHKVSPPGAGERQQLLSELRGGKVTPLFPFGGQVVGVRAAGTRLLYDVYPRRFPLVDWRAAVIEDLPAPGFGRIGRIWFGSEHGLRERAFTELRTGEQHTVATLVDAIRVYQRMVLQYRQLEAQAKRSRTQHERVRALEREMNLGRGDRQAVMRALSELVGQYGPGPSDAAVPLSATMSPAAAGAAPSPGAGLAHKPASAAPAPAAPIAVKPTPAPSGKPPGRGKPATGGNPAR